MKVLVGFDPGYQETHVDLTLEEIVQALSQDPDRRRTVYTGFNNFYSFMKAIPDSVLEEMGPAARSLVAKGLREFAARLEATPQPLTPSEAP